MRLSGLDGLRGIAAICVLIFHSSGSLGKPTFIAGWLAVDFFFALSGYVMARTYERRFDAGLRPLSFIFARYCRMAPTVFVSGMIALPVVFASNDTTLILASIPNLFLIPTFFVGHNFPLNNPLWSLILEIEANAIHAVGRHFFTDRVLLLLIAFCAVGTVVIQMTSGDFAPGGHGNAGLLIGIPRVMLSYFLGIWLYRQWRDRPPVRFPQIATMLALPTLFVVFDIRGSFPLLSLVSFALIANPLLIMGGLSLKENAGLHWLGRISFPLYAVHIPVLKLGEMLSMPAWVGIAASILIAAALADLRWHRLERFALERDPRSKII